MTSWLQEHRSFFSLLGLPVMIEEVVYKVENSSISTLSCTWFQLMPASWYSLYSQWSWMTWRYLLYTNITVCTLTVSYCIMLTNIIIGLVINITTKALENTEWLASFLYYIHKMIIVILCFAVSLIWCLLLKKL